MSNEELAAAYQAGDPDALPELWERVRLLVLKFAYKWAGIGRLELEDLMQVGFIAVMEAADTYDGSAAFTTWLGWYIKKEFNKACGQRTERQRREPLLNAASLDAPLPDDEGGDSGTFGDLVADPAAEVAFETVEERDRADQLHAILEEAIAALPPEQQNAIRGRYWRGEVVNTRDHDRALKRLRRPSVSRQLRAYM